MINNKNFSEAQKSLGNRAIALFQGEVKKRLVGELLTLAECCFTDKEQREAVKSRIKSIMYDMPLREFAEDGIEGILRSFRVDFDEESEKK